MQISIMHTLPFLGALKVRTLKEVSGVSNLPLLKASCYTPGTCSFVVASPYEYVNRLSFLHELLHCVLEAIEPLSDSCYVMTLFECLLQVQSCGSPPEEIAKLATDVPEGGLPSCPMQ